MKHVPAANRRDVVALDRSLLLVLSSALHLAENLYLAGLLHAAHGEDVDGRVPPRHEDAQVPPRLVVVTDDLSGADLAASLLQSRERSQRQAVLHASGQKLRARRGEKAAVDGAVVRLRHGGLALDLPEGALLGALVELPEVEQLRRASVKIGVRISS